MNEILKSLQERYNLTLDNNDRIYVRPINQYSFTAFPLPVNKSKCVLLTAEQFMAFMCNAIMFSEDLKSLVPYHKEADIDDDGQEE